MAMASDNAYKLASSIPVTKQLHRQLLTCPLCLGRYLRPKLLPCFHTFCESCLREYIPAESLSATCPICRHPSILPRDDGISGLQDNIFIINLMHLMDKQTLCACCEKVRALSRCSDCDVLVCDSCVAVHAGSAPSTAHHVITFSDVTHPTTPMAVSGCDGDACCDGGLKCASHDGQTLKFYCSDCETAVCEVCTYWEHVSHPTVELCGALDSQREMLAAVLDGVDGHVETLKRALANVRELSDNVRSNYSEIAGQITEAFEALAEEVRRRRDTLLAELETTHADRQMSLAHQADCLENLLLDVTNCCELTQSALKHGNETEVLLVRKEMTEKLARLKEAPAPEPETTWSRLARFDLDTSVLSGVARYLRTVGDLTTCVGADGATVTAQAAGDRLARCVSRQPVVVSLTTRDSNGRLVSVGRNAFSTRITTVNEGDERSVCGSDNGDIVCFPDVVHKEDAEGLYELTYVIPEPGRYRLDLRLHGKHVAGSPFVVVCSTAVQTAPSPLNSRSRTAVTPGRPSARQRSPSKPRAAAAAASTQQPAVPRGAGTKRPASSPPSNRSCSQSRLRQSSATVTPPTRVRAAAAAGPQRSGVASKPSCPPVIVRRRQKTVADVPASPTVSRTSRIPAPSPRITRSTSRVVSTMDFSGPSDEHDDADDRWPVDEEAKAASDDKQMDSCQGLVVLGTPGSGLVLKVGRQGHDRGEFINPQGVCYSDADGGLVLVVDNNCACVQVFSAVTGEFRLRFGRRGHLSGQLMRPTGIAVTSSGNYLVADNENCSLNVFSPSGQFISRLTGTKLMGPKGVCAELDGPGRLAVVDNKGCSIVVYNDGGCEVGKFGTRGSDRDHLSGPQYCAFIAAEVAGQSPGVVVTDFHKHTVQVFGVEDGQLRFSFGSHGQGNGQFDGPTGVAVDRAGNILVADWRNARIQVFDGRGTFLAHVDTSADPLYGPQGLAVGSANDLVIVSDSGNHCFKIFKHPFSA